MRFKLIVVAGCLIGTLPISALSQSIDRSALEALYHATDGPNWTNSDGWLSDQPLDEWYGVTAYESRVVELRLVDNGLSGTLPLEIAQLDQLRALDLRWNQLVGDLTGALGYLVELENLRLGSNLFSGEIPRELGYLADLSFLDLSYNRFEGSIPVELGHLPQLEGLGLQHNQLSGQIPASLGRAPELRNLIVGHNELSGSMPVGLEALDRLNVAETQIERPYETEWVAPVLRAPSGAALMDEWIDVLPDGPIGDMIFASMQAIHVSEGLIWVDPRYLVADLGEELARVVQEINDELLRTGERIGTLDDLARVMERYGGKRIELQDSSEPMDSGLSGFGEASARPVGGHLMTASTVDLDDFTQSSDARERFTAGGSSSDGDHAADHQSILVTCATNIGTPTRWQDHIYAAVATQCRFEYGTAQTMRYNLELQIGRRESILGWTYYVPMVTRSFRKVGLHPIWLSSDTGVSFRCRRSGTFRAIRKLFVEGDHDGWLYPHPGLRASRSIYLVC